MFKCNRLNINDSAKFAKLVHSGHSNYNTNTITHDFKDQNALCSYCFVNTLSLESDEDVLIM